MSGHAPVLLAEVMAALQPRPGGLYIDATFGAGGYSAALLGAGARVVAFDRDPTARAFADRLESEGDLTLVQASFSAIAREVGPGRADGAAFDLGVSSMQLDEAARGFSLLRDGPLDMRMGGDGRTAAQIVNEAPEAELARIFRDFGEERAARRIAAHLVRRRGERPFERTLDLAEAVERALGGRRGARIHPATRVFQALRIAVNDELAELAAGLGAAETALKAGAVLAVVAFHSLEDRIVKTFLAERSGSLAGGSRHAPPVAASRPPTFTLLAGGAKAPSEAEVAANPRARSARLRAARRTAAPPWKLAA